jgi:hypothetical protein
MRVSPIARAFPSLWGWDSASARSPRGRPAPVQPPRVPAAPPSASAPRSGRASRVAEHIARKQPPQGRFPELKHFTQFIRSHRSPVGPATHTSAYPCLASSRKVASARSSVPPAA